jgi:hypothetical protein
VNLEVTGSSGGFAGLGGLIVYGKLLSVLRGGKGETCGRKSFSNKIACIFGESSLGAVARIDGTGKENEGKFF